MKYSSSMIDLLVVILIVAKLAGWISISWWLVFLPGIIEVGIVVVVGIGALIWWIIERIRW